MRGCEWPLRFLIITVPNLRTSNDISNTSLFDLNRTNTTNTTISSSLDDTAAVITRIAESGTDSDGQGRTKKIKKEMLKDDSEMEAVTTPKESTAKVTLREVKKEILVQRSARGRMIKPRMQTWAGERIVYDIDGNPICASSVTTRAFNESESSEKMVGTCINCAH